MSLLPLTPSGWLLPVSSRLVNSSSLTLLCRIPRRRQQLLNHRLQSSSVIHLPSSHFSSRSHSSGGNISSYLPTVNHRSINYGICIVPQTAAWVIERFGKFHRVLPPGLHFLIPLVDRIAYIHSLKEQAIPISQQQAITMDNVTINIDGVLYLRVVDPQNASYGVNDIYYAMTQLAQTTMRSELGKITLDQTFANRESLNSNIVNSINTAAAPWGVQCLRYEIKDITPPASVKLAMDMQAEAERKKRATILDSEGSQQSEINVADGQRQATILAAQGEAAAILARAEATAKGIDLLSQAIQRKGGQAAVSLRIAEQYVAAFSQLAKKGNTILLPANAADPSSMITQAIAIYDNILKKNKSETSNIDNTDDENEKENNSNNNDSAPSAINTDLFDSSSASSPASFLPSSIASSSPHTMSLLRGLQQQSTYTPPSSSKRPNTQR